MGQQAIIRFAISITCQYESSEDITTNGVGAKYTLANGLTLAAATVKSENDTTSSEYTANHYEASMAVASGLTAVITVIDYDYKVTAANHEATPVADSGTMSQLTIKTSF